jgi:hypothetical protein
MAPTLSQEQARQILANPTKQIKGDLLNSIPEEKENE